MGKPNQVTEKKIAANRGNALKSTGPTSKRGKHFARVNALRHGLFAQSVILLPGEDPEDFIALRRAFRDSYQPKTQTEHFLVDRLITASWRLTRVNGMEARILEAQYNAQESSRASSVHIMMLVRELIMRPPPDTEHLRIIPSSEALARQQEHDQHFETLSQSADFSESQIGRALVCDSEHGNAVSKLDRRQNSLERSFYRALQQLERLRQRHNQPESQILCR